MRSKEDFKREYMSENCFYWSETTKETNQITEVAKYFGIKSQTGYFFSEAKSPLSMLTIFKKNGELIIQRIDMWGPNRGLDVRNENCMYAEFKELSTNW
jgi:hypothetical protein